VSHIQLLESSGFAREYSTVHHLAFQFAEKLTLKYKFDRKSLFVGYDWLLSFLKRNVEIYVGQGEEISVARSQDTKREDVNH
jgi:hypothetical protein